VRNGCHQRRRGASAVRTRHCGAPWNIALSATGGFSSSSFSSLFEGPSRIFSIGPAISQTIFNGGLYPAQLHQFEAIYNADLAAYR
jgi:outer membrane protein TolC